jgi:protein-tyrosine phosphatase
MNFIDIHCHILPGMDDGPADIKESLTMARMAVDDGVTHVFATPHIEDGLYGNRAAGIREAVESLKGQLPAGLTLLYGADVRICYDLIDRVEKDDIPTLNGSDYLLLEFPHFALPPRVDEIVISLRQRGIIPVITHPERHLLLSRHPEFLGLLRDCGAMSQVTAGSITGGFGKETRKTCMMMIKKGLVDFVASDAHDPVRRPPQLSVAFREVISLFGEETALRIFIRNQEDILEAAVARGTSEARVI